MPTWSQQQLKPFLETLHNGGVAAAPAEGMYGYVANALNPQALEEIIKIKQRDPSKGLIVLISSLKQLELLTPHPMQNPWETATRTHWPYPPVTLILPAKSSLSPLLTGAQPTIAVRYPHADYMLEYIDAFGGPLVSTSLNLTGEPPATSAQQIPAGTPALTLAKQFSGRPSQIFNPESGLWLR